MISSVHALKIFDLINPNVKIISSLDSTLLGKEGKVLNETKNMLLLDVNNSLISVPKNIISLKLNVDDVDYVVQGSKLLHSPSNRNTKLELSL